jgi:hypothetical protein
MNKVIIILLFVIFCKNIYSEEYTPFSFTADNSDVHYSGYVPYGMYRYSMSGNICNENIEFTQADWTPRWGPMDPNDPNYTGEPELGLIQTGVPVGNSFILLLLIFIYTLFYILKDSRFRKKQQ